MPDLTPRETRFVEAFLGPSRFNATDAARRAGYAWPGKQGHQVMARARVRAEVERGFQSMRPGALKNNGITTWEQCEP